jgi:hypothetical protein
MTAVRRGALVALTVALLAAAAFGVGYAMRQPTGADIAIAPAGAPVRATPTKPRPSPTPTQAPTPAVAPAAPVVETPVVETPAVATPGPPLLQQGATGARVRDVQARLRQLAWYFETPDGTYGDSTVEAVEGFQGKRGYPVTGSIDQRTMNKLRRMTTDPTRDQLGLPNVPGPLDSRCRTGRVLCIDKTSDTLRWVVDGQVRKTVDVRFGASYTPTREGEFSVYLKDADHVSHLYGSAMPYSMFFSRGQAVHYSSDFAARGYAGASHGCVNVRDEAAVAWLYDQVRVGDRVVIYRS